jgi:DNA-binding IclR family transcriptional regulator
LPVIADGMPAASLRSIDRAAAVLRTLALHEVQGARLAEVTAAVGLGKATVHRLLGALVAVGFVDFDGTAKRYRLGYGLHALGAAARRFGIVELARPSLRRLARATGDTVYLSLRDGDEALCLDRATGAYPIRTLTLDIGDRRPLGVGAGALALLAFLPEAEVARLVRSTRAARAGYAGFDDAALAGLVAETRAAGFSFNDGRIVGAMCALGAPVHDGAGRLVAALSIAAIRERMGSARRAELVALLQDEAAEIGRQADAAAVAAAGEGRGGATA